MNPELSRFSLNMGLLGTTYTWIPRVYCTAQINFIIWQLIRKL
jgi:hypothetical protein